MRKSGSGRVQLGGRALMAASALALAGCAAAPVARDAVAAPVSDAGAFDAQVDRVFAWTSPEAPGCAVARPRFRPASGPPHPGSRPAWPGSPACGAKGWARGRATRPSADCFRRSRGGPTRGSWSSADGRPQASPRRRISRPDGAWPSGGPREPHRPRSPGGGAERSRPARAAGSDGRAIPGPDRGVRHP